MHKIQKKCILHLLYIYMYFFIMKKKAGMQILSDVKQFFIGNKNLLQSWFTVSDNNSQFVICIFTGLIGFTLDQILVYESKPEPAKLLLVDLDQTHRMTIKQLVEYLAKPEMQRHDIIEKLSKFLNGVWRSEQDTGIKIDWSFQNNRQFQCDGYMGNSDLN